MLEQWWRSWFAATSAGHGPIAQGEVRAAVDAAIDRAGGTRSLIYSVATYLLRVPGMSLAALAVAQAAAVGLVVRSLHRSLLPDSGIAAAVAVAAAAALFTSAPWYAVYASPDILAGLTIGGAIVLTVFFDRIGMAQRLLLVALVAFGITTHGSHLPVAIVVLAAGTGAHFWLQRQPLHEATRRAAWFASPIVLALGAQLATSYVAFGDASIAPKRYPILLARSVADGPGAWHLRKHCRTERYAICEVFGPNPPRKVGDFLWAEGGVRHRATPAQMERIRSEESLIVRRATLEYPLEQVTRSVRNAAAQTFEFGLSALRFGFVLEGANDPVLVAAGPAHPRLKAASQAVVYIGFVAGICLIIAVRRRLERVELATLAVAVAGLLTNAAVCGVISGVTDRYQGRVAWILPVLAFVIASRVWAERREGRARRESLSSPART